MFMYHVPSLHQEDNTMINLQVAGRFRFPLSTKDEEAEDEDEEDETEEASLLILSCSTMANATAWFRMELSR